MNKIGAEAAYMFGCEGGPVATSPQNSLVPARACQSCGYTLTGLAEGHVCPECGFDDDPRRMQESVERWFAGWDGLLVRDPPPKALLLLDTPRCHGIAKRRFWLLFALPWVMVFAVAVGIGSFRATITYERWWEDPQQPGARLDVDSATGVVRLLGAESETDMPYLPAGASARRRERAAVVVSEFFWAVGVPRGRVVWPIAVFVTVTMAGRLAIWLALSLLAFGTWHGKPIRDVALPIWPALSWLGVPNVAGCLCLGLGLVAMAVSDGRLTHWRSEDVFGVTMIASLGVFLVAGCRAAFVGAGSLAAPRTNARIRCGISAVAGWTVLMPVILTLLWASGFAVAIALQLLKGIVGY
jgi:hypothetical protein